MMKQISYLFISFSMILLAGGCSTANFPVSNVTPGAHIKLVNKTDKHGNHQIRIKADHLASPDRLQPPRETYVIWAETKEGIINLGFMDSSAHGKSKFETTIPYSPEVIFITAEDSGTVSYPTGEEISRVTAE